MQEALKVILDIQEYDMKMIRLMRLKRERQKELQQIDALRKELHQQLLDKEQEIGELGKAILAHEQKIQEINAKIKRIETQQSNIKKADEFNAITQEMTTAEREKVAVEQKVSDLVDKKNTEEELLDKIKHSLKNSEESSKSLEKEIQESIEMINEEGSSLKKQREDLAKSANLEMLAIYERLLKNKRDRVIVPIENRTCSGCHIVLTAQHENLVRKGENLIFCEHCSRIHYWQEAEAASEEVAGTKRRRRRFAGA
ncbi:MAG: C4-type zinc ribbon domain-containing protein [Chlamydiae bacterium]|nr:C4-type zinc ribbon domain-containing protein [Chlamydiota bacterium]